MNSRIDGVMISPQFQFADEIKAVTADLSALYKPVTPTEHLLVERLAALQWKYFRILRVMTEAREAQAKELLAGADGFVP